MKKQSQVIGGAGDTTQGATATVRDNLYLAVNGEWLKTAKIPADKPRTGGFSDLDLAIEEQMMHDLDQFANGEQPVPNDLMAQAVKLYQIAGDFDQRNQQGFSPAQAGYEEIKNLTSWADYLAKLPSWIKQPNRPLPFGFGVDADMKNTQINVVYATTPSLILPDTTYYTQDNAAGQHLLTVYQKAAQQLLIKAGETPQAAAQIVSQALAFDRSLVAHVKSALENADYVKSYNPQSMEEFTKQGGEVNFENIIQAATHTQVDQVIVTEPKFFQDFTTVVNAQVFPQLRSWTLVRYLFSVSSYLSQELREIAGQYSLALNGNQTLTAPAKQAYHITNTIFDEVLGQYYGKKYFGQQAKADVEQMVRRMIAIYEQRIQKNTWLSPDTKAQAIVKLKKMVLKIGYPEQLRPLYQKLVVNEQLDLLSNINQIMQVVLDDAFARLQRPVDRTEWAMPGHLVNACYDPSRNDITFPAGILQAPFYSLEQTASQNYGGIGAVIAHEISHGFDNNGAQFDELGNLHNWWTTEDYATFKKLTQAMIDEFEGLDFGPGKVNGELVVSENVADAGGLSCALEAAKQDTDCDLVLFFENWARVWRTKSTPEFAQMLLQTDVHAPSPMRANVQAQNMDDFYTTFHISEEDGMWLAPEKRVNIW